MEGHHFSARLPSGAKQHVVPAGQTHVLSGAGLSLMLIQRVGQQLLSRPQNLNFDEHHLVFFSGNCPKVAATMLNYGVGPIFFFFEEGII